MKSTDLMVGDSIYRADCYDKVVEIRSNGIIGADANRGLIPFDEIKPIEITPEILEKIGFNLLPQNTKIDSYHLSYPNTIHPKFGINVNMFTVLEMIIFNDNRRLVYLEVNYVHELQHALRLCGIEKEIIL